MRNIFVSVLWSIILLFSAGLNAKTFYFEQGQSKHFKLKEKIDTIFISAPAIADYEILDDNSFVVYAKGDGLTEISVLGIDGQELMSDTFVVDGPINDMANVNDQINIRFPKSNLWVKKIGKAYVIEGKAKNDREAEEVNRIVGEAVGSPSKVIEAKIDGKIIPFLDKYKYKNVINLADLKETTQINVKLTVAEVSKKFTEELGVNWTHLGSSVLKNPTLGSTAIQAGFGGGSAFLRLINAGNFELFLKALNDQDNGKILAKPNISMLSGETSNILVGGEIPFVQYDKEGKSTVIYKDFGVKLGVGAKLQKNDRIRLFLKQEVSSLGKSINYGDLNLPLINTRRSTSTFELANGESFIIGGLYSSEDLEGLSKVPFLGDIPILGAFFRNATTGRTSRELVIVATVNFVKPVQGEDVVYPSFEKTGTMERFFNTTSLKNTHYEIMATNFLKRGGFIQ
ncbi:type II and III secretion system protein family protein [Pasteurella skyensis]|uniref:Type II and III secretion system protein family protein n=1 Tax=Phocoenobacter skyensis TaxID=97481 RepID=A0AAJ6NDQ0_9PAST|nr:type II and III secretion system protein family protein [Pasteurella skyensis]MDP8170822.1 type II and III secretion system protein family protein [Pasteurella skyensis]MDP8174928.1 type II and III secretion system protein family protein [Pasteurella skyensis]